MEISIGPLWAVAYMNNLTKKINVYPKLFESREEAQRLADEIGGEVETVFFRKK